MKKTEMLFVLIVLICMGSSCAPPTNNTPISPTGKVTSLPSATPALAQATSQPTTAPAASFSLEKSAQEFKVSGTFQAGLSDLDGDGDLDAVLANPQKNYSQVWLNDGGGHFTDTGQQLTQYGHGVGVADFDGDGDLDAFIACHYFVKPSQVYLNDGHATFQSNGQDLGDANISGAELYLVDLNGDGNMDVHVMYYDPKGLPDKVYLNDGKANFADSGLALDEETIAWGDLDGDGDVDYFGKRWGQGYVVMLNDGSGQFATGWQMDDSQSTNGGVALADFDGDGDLDALVANGTRSQGSHPTRLLWNDGIQGGTLGQFTDSGQQLNKTLGAELGVGDLDADGDLDVFVSNFDLPNEVWLNDGEGHLLDSGLRLGTNADSSAKPSLGDLDGDGDLDVFVGSLMGKPEIWLNTATPKPSTATVLLIFGQQFIHDIYTVVRPALEEAGYRVVVASRTMEPLKGKNVNVQVAVDLLLEDVQVENYDAILFNCDNDITFGTATAETNRIAQEAITQNKVLAAICSGPRVLAYADVVEGIKTTGEPSQACAMLEKSGATCTGAEMERDGLIITARDRYASRAYVQAIIEAMQEQSAPPIATPKPDSSLVFKKSAQIFPSIPTWKIGLADLDKDGDLDAVFANGQANDSQVWLNDDSGFFTDTGQQLGLFGHGIDIGDVDRDGDPDVVISTHQDSAPSRVYLNDGKAVFQELAGAFDANIGFSLDLFDLDKDGDLDAVGEGTSATNIYLNDGAGTFEPGEMTFPLTTAWGDLDSDKDVDVFVKKEGVGYSVRLNDGGVQGGTPGSFSQHWSHSDSTAMLLGDIALGDVDNDGDLDTIITNGHFQSTAYPAMVFINDGTGSFTDSGQRLSTVRNAGIGLGDLDGDGDLDLTLTDYMKPCQIWLNDGDGQFTDSGFRFGDGQFYRHVHLGDLDRDGDLDILLATFSLTSGPNEIWFNQRY